MRTENFFENKNEKKIGKVQFSELIIDLDVSRLIKSSNLKILSLR